LIGYIDQPERVQMSRPAGNDALHRQYARELRNDIESSRLRPGMRLPSTRELAAKWGVSTGVVVDAMELLIRDGLVVTRDRSGRFVAGSAATPGARPARGRARAIFVGGYAGSGKTEFGRTLARETGWAIMDKDTLTREIVDTALVQLGSNQQDRESKTYLEVVRPAEYACLDAAMLENIACGVSVICTAPYLREFNQQRWFERTQSALAVHDADMVVVWIRASGTAMHSYVQRRAALRDSWKLAHWDDYMAGVDVEFTPPWPHTIIHNGPDAEPLQAQARALLRSLLPET
jgi:DNA-binding transcriptional regulator YhcF (GntR family)/predicted kinase